MGANVLHNGGDVLIGRTVVLDHQIAAFAVWQNVIVVCLHHMVFPLVQTALQWDTPFPDVALNATIKTQFQIAIHKTHLLHIFFGEIEIDKTFTIQINFRNFVGPGKYVQIEIFAQAGTGQYILHLIIDTIQIN